MASSMPATDFTLTIGARYSVDQSSSEASIALSSKPTVSSQHLISHSASKREVTSLGTKEGEIFSLISIVSTAPQIPVLRIFAFKQIDRALSSSASSSTYM